MSTSAIALILAAAIMHASWNFFCKQAAAAGAVYFVWLFGAWATVLYAPVVLVTAVLGRPHLTGINWAFLAGTGIVHSGYFMFLQQGYRLGDLSVAYPIGRGTGAMLATVAGIVLLGERPAPVAIAGIIAILAGVVLIGYPHGKQRASAGALAFALATGALVACYTVWDKYAVANLHTEPVFQGYAGFSIMTMVITPFVLRDRARLGEVWRASRPQVIGAAVLSPLTYFLILVALSFTAVSTVAPAREISVLFGVLIGRQLLGEGGVVRRLIAGAAIVAGIIAVAVG